MPKNKVKGNKSKNSLKQKKLDIKSKKIDNKYNLQQKKLDIKSEKDKLRTNMQSKKYEYKTKKASKGELSRAIQAGGSGISKTALAVSPSVVSANSGNYSSYNRDAQDALVDNGAVSTETGKEFDRNSAPDSSNSNYEESVLGGAW